MKKIIMILILALFIPGCMGSATKLMNTQKELVEQIPDNSFTNFEYRRTGAYSSALITAKNGQKIDGQIIIESILMDIKYGPEALLIKLEGYNSGTEEVK